LAHKWIESCISEQEFKASSEAKAGCTLPVSTYGPCPRIVNTGVQNDTCNFTGRAGYSGEPTRPVNTARKHTGSVCAELNTKQDDVVEGACI